MLDVNRLTVMPQQPNIVATCCDEPEVRHAALNAVCPGSSTLGQLLHSMNPCRFSEKAGRSWDGRAGGGSCVPLLPCCLSGCDGAMIEGGHGPPQLTRLCCPVLCCAGVPV